MTRLDWKVLRDDGYLQEVNRQFFHPLGLALAVTVNGETCQLSILDARDDPEGFNFATGDDLTDKAQRLTQITDARREARIKGLGYWVQPVQSYLALESDVS